MPTIYMPNGTPVEQGGPEDEATWYVCGLCNHKGPNVGYVQTPRAFRGQALHFGDKRCMKTCGGQKENTESPRFIYRLVREPSLVRVQEADALGRTMAQAFGSDMNTIMLGRNASRNRPRRLIPRPFQEVMDELEEEGTIPPESEPSVSRRTSMDDLMDLYRETFESPPEEVQKEEGDDMDVAHIYSDITKLAECVAKYAEHGDTDSGKQARKILSELFTLGICPECKCARSVDYETKILEPHKAPRDGKFQAVPCTGVGQKAIVPDRGGVRVDPDDDFADAAERFALLDLPDTPAVEPRKFEPKPEPEPRPSAVEPEPEKPMDDTEKRFSLLDLD